MIIEPYADEIRSIFGIHQISERLTRDPRLLDIVGQLLDSDVFNSVENKPGPPYCGNRPQPEFIAGRRYVDTLRPQRQAA